MKNKLLLLITTLTLFSFLTFISPAVFATDVEPTVEDVKENWSTYFPEITDMKTVDRVDIFKEGNLRITYHTTLGYVKTANMSIDDLVYFTETEKNEVDLPVTTLRVFGVAGVILAIAVVYGVFRIQYINSKFDKKYLNERELKSENELRSSSEFDETYEDE